MPVQQAHPHQHPHGAILLDAGRTRFCLWAPDAQTVSVAIDGGADWPMQAQAAGWFCCTLACGAGTGYCYCIDGKLRVPDPASRAQASDVHSPSLVVDPLAYHWRHPEWCGRPWHEAVIYEVHVGAIGGYAALGERLAGLAELGITAIELMPLAEFPGARNWGYDGVLPYAPESSYGPPEALKQLIDSAHGHGLMVFLDVVYNHFGPHGNFIAQYAKAFFRHDQPTPWGDAIDFRHPQVRDFFIDSALQWLQEYRFDGLRLDAVHAISDKSFLRELAARVRAALPAERHVHLVLENEDNSASLLAQGFTAQWNDDGHNALHVLLTGESEGYYADYCRETTQKLARCLAEGFVYQGQLNRHGKPRGEPSGHLPPSAFVLFLQNHDQIGNRAFGERLSDLVDAQALRAATSLLLLSPMIPLLFMGEEIAVCQPFLYFTSHPDELADAVRIGRRAEFASFAAFADAAQRERIPAPNAEATFALSRPDFDCADAPGHAEWHAFYRQLLSLRHREIVPRLPGARALGAEVLAEAALSARWRLGDGQVLRIELNLAEHAVALAAEPSGRLLFASRAVLEQRHSGMLASNTALVFLEPGDDR
jgi:maltooligosyltrehalose trehalohydrolase